MNDPRYEFIDCKIVKCNACKMTMQRGLKGELFEKHYQEICIISCTNTKCNDTSITRVTLEEHRKICPFEQVSCSAHDIGCDMILPRYLIKSHENQCVKFIFSPTRHSDGKAGVSMNMKEIILMSIKSDGHNEADMNDTVDPDDLGVSMSVEI
jgi:hypothetical protein